MRIDHKDIRRWYLELNNYCFNDSIISPIGTKVKRFNGGINEYRYLNKLIGADLGWVDRQLISDTELENILGCSDIKIFVLLENDNIIGFTEIDFRDKEIVKLEYFGLIPAARGKGYGKFLLCWTINEIWKYSPRKIRLNTSSQDHPNALPNYLKAGFIIIEEKIEKQAIIIED